MSTRSKCAAEVVRVAMNGVRDRADIHYTQTLLRWSGINRSITVGQPPYADCSSYATFTFWRARKKYRGGPGVDIVNGANWKAGYTGTMLNHGIKHRSRTSSRFYKAGRTLIFYGPGTKVTHVAIYVGNGMVVSHGSEAGPLLLPWNYRGVIEARVYPL